MSNRWVFLVLLVLSHCAPVVFLGSSASQFKAQPQNKISPQAAYEKAKPHLAGIFETRCREIHRNDEHWCKKTPIDYMVMRASYYYITRTSYPYKTYNAYLNYAVRVHVDTGDVILPAEK